MSMQELFDQLGIKDDRTRILAVVSSPQVFFDRCRTEDEAMIVAAPFIKHTLLHIIQIKSQHLDCLAACYRNIQYAITRDVLYAMRDQAYLDTFIAWAKTTVAKVLDMHIDFSVRYINFIQEETGIPVFATYKEYEEYNERQSKA